MTIRQRRRVDDANDVAVDEDHDAAKPASGEHSAPGRVISRIRPAIEFSRRWVLRSLAHWHAIVLTTAVVATVGLAVALFFFQYRPNQQTDGAAAQHVIKAASDGTVAVLSSSPETIDNDLKVANSHLTGNFLRYFNDFGRQFLAPAVRQHRVKASASVLRAAVVDLHPDSAVVLLFIHQTTTSSDKPEPVLTTNSVRVTLKKVNGDWLISKFEPE
ncbi:twin-arginine translocation pathway signal [Mycobacterium botniense]|uniref:Twin-arginine translocation pathway signal n=1 Tax=Mycobacterium botniense TaxID=84962 RepID=A0A7I9XXK2_9MYCO|nr:twin-arginine translocation pathway signal [Mycobacterium botniense]GFG74510.1 hypothetical protein MBOT_18750 [Mycobacterium botniense]